MQKRYVLWWLVVFQTICNTIVMMNMNIVIVSMVNVDRTTDTKHVAFCPNTSIFTQYYFDDQPQLSASQVRFNWTESEQTMVVSGVQWLNYFSVLPGGVLAHKYGSKSIVGYTQVISSIMSSLIPFVAYYGAFAVSCIRAIQGFLSVMAFPGAINTIVGNWSPPEERGRFEMTFLIGCCFGTSVGSICFGYLAQYVDWRYVFHLTSICGLIWGVMWYALVHDTPQQHPTISSEERKYIEDSLKDSFVNIRTSIPWKGILTSVPVILSLLASNSGLWLIILVVMYSPLYFNKFYGLESNQIGIISGVWQLLAGIMSVVVGYTSDLVIKKGLISITAMRKCNAFIGYIVSAILLIIVAYTDCDANLVLICMTIQMIIQVCGAFGPTISVIDMSPKFCGILVGISVTFGYAQFFIFSSVMNYLSNIWDTEKVWKFTFLFTAFYCILMNVLYIIFGTSKIRKWNFQNRQHSIKKLQKMETVIIN